MAKAEIIAAFIAKIQDGYNLPHHMNLTGKSERLRGIVEILNKEDEAVLEYFAGIWVEEYTKTILPTWTDAVRVLKIARAKIAADRQQANYQAKLRDNEQKIKEDVSYPRLADAAMPTDLGRQACDQGWQCNFYDFVMKNGRHPNLTEIARLRAEAERTERRWLEMRPKEEWEKTFYTARNGRMAALRDAAYGRGKLVEGGHGPES